MKLIFLYVSVDTGFSQIFKFFIGQNFWKKKKKPKNEALVPDFRLLVSGGSTRKEKITFFLPYRSLWKVLRPRKQRQQNAG